MELARQNGHSRFPVLDQDDVVIGTSREARRRAADRRATATKVKHLMTRPIVVPDSLRLDPLLSLLRQEGQPRSSWTSTVIRPAS